MTLPTTAPASFEAGTTVSFTQAATHTAFGLASASAGWSLTWLLRRTDGADEADVPGTPNGDGWTVTLAAAASELLAPGAYRWALRASEGGQVATLSHGTCTVTPDLSASGEDVRTWEERTLAIVEAAMAGTLESEMRMYMIAGRQVWTFSPEELMRLRDRLQAVVQVQRTGTFGVPMRFDVVGLR